MAKLVKRGVGQVHFTQNEKLHLVGVTAQFVSLLQLDLFFHHIYTHTLTHTDSQEARWEPPCLHSPISKTPCSLNSTQPKWPHSCWAWKPFVLWSLFLCRRLLPLAGPGSHLHTEHRKAAEAQAAAAAHPRIVGLTHERENESWLPQETHRPEWCSWNWGKHIEVDKETTPLKGRLSSLASTVCVFVCVCETVWVTCLKGSSVLCIFIADSRDTSRQTHTLPLSLSLSFFFCEARPCDRADPSVSGLELMQAHITDTMWSVSLYIYINCTVWEFSTHRHTEPELLMRKFQTVLSWWDIRSDANERVEIRNGDYQMQGLC